MEQLERLRLLEPTGVAGREAPLIVDCLADRRRRGVFDIEQDLGLGIAESIESASK